MEILVGREPGKARLLITCGDKTATIGTEGTVPNGVSRTRHCVIHYNSDNDIVVENGKPENVTYVDGAEIEKKSATINSRIELGRCRYAIDIKSVLAAVKSAVKPMASNPQVNAGGQKPTASAQEPPTFSLRVLEPVWEKYDKDIMDMQIQQAKSQNKMRLQGLLSMSATFLALLQLNDYPVISILRFVLMGGALVFAAYSFWKSGQTDNLFIVKKKERDNRLQKDYTCPNPACKVPKGFMPFSQLKYQPGCPHCKCKYVYK